MHLLDRATSEHKKKVLRSHKKWQIPQRCHSELHERYSATLFLQCVVATRHGPITVEWWANVEAVGPPFNHDRVNVSRQITSMAFCWHCRLASDCRARKARVYLGSRRPTPLSSSMTDSTRATRLTHL